VQIGRIADLVLLKKNPLDDIANTRSITGVIADGRYFSSADLEQLKVRLKTIAAGK
jgi:imidazolonepropionase-like amidohydrolase